MSPRARSWPEVRALLERERVILPVSASQRARAMARARAALATPAVATTAPSSAAPRIHWTAAAAAVVVLSAAVGAAAYEVRARLAPAPATRSEALAPVSEVAASPPASSVPAVPAGDLAPTPVPTSAAPGLSPAEAIRAELRLLRQARAAVARGDFADALPPINEHTRRFKNGRLVEEREALRVKALASLGRTDEAHRAATAFRARFPRSVLLPAVSQMSISGP